MAGQIADSSADVFDVDCSLEEFEELDRRRLFGAPALAISEVEHWLELRARLEFHLGKGSEGAIEERRFPGTDRRDFIRLPTHIKIQFSSPSDLQPQVARDVSQGGLFIATHRPLKVGSEVRLQLELDGSSIEVAGSVAWAQEEDSADRAAGMGIRFGKLQLEQRRALSRFVQDLAFKD